MTSFFLDAQKLDKPEVYYGINFGMTASQIYFSPSVNQNYLTGYNGGVIFRYIGDKSLGLQTELNFSQRGWKETDNLYTKQLNYIELPFLTHFNFGNKFRFFFNVGPKISYLISEKILTNNTNGATDYQYSKGVENPFDYGFCAGLGCLMNIKGQVFQLEGRGAYSVSNIFSDAKKDYFDYSNNLTASVNFSWLIQTQ